MAIEWFRHEHIQNGSIDIHPHDAKKLGFELQHPFGQMDQNGRRVSSYTPLTVEIRLGMIDPSRHRECHVCGDDHEALVVAYLVAEKRRDSGLVQVSEEQEKQWAEEGLGRGLAHAIASSGLAEDEVMRRLAIGPYALKEPELASEINKLLPPHQNVASTARVDEHEEDEEEETRAGDQTPARRMARAARKSQVPV